MFELNRLETTVSKPKQLIFQVVVCLLVCGLSNNQGVETAVADDSLRLKQPLSSTMFYEETMAVIVGEHGVAAIRFEKPSMIGDEQNGRFLVEYKWRFDDGSGEEATGTGVAYTGFQDGKVTLKSKVLQAGPYEIGWSTIDTRTGQLFFDPEKIALQQVDKRWFDEHDVGIREQEKRPAVKLSRWADDSVKDPAELERTHPLVTKVRYDRHDLVIIDRDSIAVIHFEDPFDEENGKERKYGVNFRFRVEASDGTEVADETNDVYEMYVEGKYNSDLTKHSIDARPAKLNWSRGGLNAGWIYFHPEQQFIWFVSPEQGEKLLDPTEPLAQFRQFRDLAE